MDLSCVLSVEQNFPGVETSEGGGSTQGWNIENLASHFREFGTYGVALGGATENS